MKTFIVRFLMLLILLAGALQAPAQDRGLQKFADRQEGILSLQAASATLLDLLSIEVVAPPSSADLSPEAHLYALLPEQVASQDLLAQVRDPGRHYWMIPDPGTLRTTNPIFDWSRTNFLEPRGIAMTQLRPLVSNADETVHFPAWVSAAGRARPAAGPRTYLFRFESRGAVFAEAKIYRSSATGWAATESDQWIRVTDLSQVDEPYPGVFSVSWTDTADQGRAPPGLYQLTLVGSLETDQVIDLKLAVPFFHDGG